MPDLLDNPFDPFADAVEESLRAMRAEIRALSDETRSLREQLATRSAPVIQPPESIDIEAIATRAAALVPVPKDGRDGKDGIDGKDGAPGKDGEPGQRGVDGLNGRDGAPGEKGERGADGIATREEIDALVEKRFAEVQVRTLADSWRGVWTPETHTRGSVTQWDGCAWLALNDTDGKPGLSGDWVLLSKRGRDGRK